jgi:hypothetical protein
MIRRCLSPLIAFPAKEDDVVMFSGLDNIKWNSNIEAQKRFMHFIGVNKKSHM